MKIDEYRAFMFDAGHSEDDRGRSESRGGLRLATLDGEHVDQE
jgi:hypothetical protein